MANYSSDYLRRLRDAVTEFDSAFEAWMQTQVESDHMSARGLFPTVWAKDEQDPAEVRRLELKVAETAGAAAKAVAVTGTYIAVAGIGAIDPIANWFMMANPKAPLSPKDVRMTAATTRGRLDTLIAEAEAASESGLPGFVPSQLHPMVWASAADHWTSHQYRVAVVEAAEGLTIHWKTKLGRNDVDGTEFWQQSLSPGEPTPERPKLHWPGDRTDKTVRSMRGGLEPMARALNDFATGLNLTVRNVATHTRQELSEQEAMERLAAYSYLARLLDKCEIRRADEEANT
ncbi:TIGR02391 family protein [Nocardia sp. NPDC052566]|uniref:TIGR02391 family protein n=1 Tax=Nocardia sp. NPDC052566 TaxID=3364330 RepID=UPI0037C85592